MPTITFEGQRFDCENNETLLESLERHGVEAPSSCRSGTCHSCTMRALDGTPPLDSQAGLKPTLQLQGYFLACICHPKEDMSVAIAGDEAHEKFTTKVVNSSPLNENIFRLRLTRPEGFNYKPGQFINLYRNDGLVRSYSIASIESDGLIELHIELLNGGRMSNWLHDKVNCGDELIIDGPHGDCFYLEGQAHQAMLLIGTGSGLAPLWGIARDALNKGHQGEIHLFHGSRNPEKLYLVDELHALTELHTNFNYVPCVSGNHTGEKIQSGRANELALARFPHLENWRIFLCGHPDMVKDTKMKAYLAGASLQDIHADAFTIANN